MKNTDKKFKIYTKKNVYIKKIVIKKHKIIGKEFKANDGGKSEAYCPNRCNVLLRRHKTGNNRYFCQVCGGKFEFKPTKIGNFLRVKHTRIGWSPTIMKATKNSAF